MMRVLAAAIFLVLALVLSLPVGELIAKAQFDEFCEENIGSLPELKISTNSVELRRGFSIIPSSWPDGLEFLEFSGARVIDGSLFEDVKKPELLSSGAYQIRHYGEAGEECRLLAAVSFGKTFENEDETIAYFGESLCEGVVKAPSLQADYYAEYVSVDNFDAEFFATILGRGVLGSSFRVYRKSDNEVIGSSDSYYMDILPFIPKPDFFPQRYQCATERLSPYAYGLDNFFK